MTDRQTKHQKYIQAIIESVGGTYKPDAAAHLLCKDGRIAYIMKSDGIGGLTADFISFDEMVPEKQGHEFEIDDPKNITWDDVPTLLAQIKNDPDRMKKFFNSQFSNPFPPPKKPSGVWRCCNCNYETDTFTAPDKCSKCGYIAFHDIPF